MRAVVEMQVDLAAISRGQAIAHIGAELRRVLITIVALPLEMHLQERLAKTLTSAIRKRRNGVRCETEQGGHFARASSLDLGVPEHELPPFRQCGKGRNGERTIRFTFRLIEQTDVDLLGHVFGRFLAIPPNAVVEHVPNCGQQIRTERHVGAAAVLQCLVHLGERLGGEIIGIAA